MPLSHTSHPENAPPTDRSAHPSCVVTTSWDDGHSLDARLADLLVRLRMPATFYVPRQGRYRQLSDAAVRDLAGSFEIGAHSLTHSMLSGLDNAQLTYEVAGSRDYIESTTGQPCHMFCYPSGDVSKRVARAVRRAGFGGARTARSLCDGRVADPFLLHTTLQACTHTPRMIRLYSPARYTSSLHLDLRRVEVMGDFDAHYDWEALARFTFHAVRARSGVWHLWGHSWEVEMCGLWDALDRVLRYVLAFPDVVLLTNGQLVQYANPGIVCPGTAERTLAEYE